MGGMPGKLVIAVVQVEDADHLVDTLVTGGFGATRLKTAGGFLRRENAVVLVATDDDRVGSVQAIVRETCRARTATWVPPFIDGVAGLATAPVEVEVGGAVVFILPIERVEFLSQVVESLSVGGAR